MSTTYDLDSSSARRVLAHLPAYRSQADWKALQADIEKKGLAPYPQHFTLDELVARLIADARFAGTPELSEEEVSEELLDMEASGLCSQSNGKWSMTNDGLKALNA